MDKWPYIFQVFQGHMTWGSVLQASALLSVPSLAFCFAIVLWPGKWRACTRTIPQISILSSHVLVLSSFSCLVVCLHTVLTIMSWYNYVYSSYEFIYNWHRHVKFFSNFSMWGTYGIASTLLIMSNFSWFVGGLYFCSFDEVVMMNMCSVLICCMGQRLYTHTRTCARVHVERERRIQDVYKFCTQHTLDSWN